MRPLLILLLCMAVLLGVYRVAFHTPDSQTQNALPDDVDVETYGQPASPPSWELDPPEGEMPSESAEFEIWHEVRREGNHHRLYIFLKETHGWWVDWIYINFWYQEVDESTGELTEYKKTLEFIPKPIDFGETLEHSFVIYETDLPMGMPKGTTANWDVEVLRWADERVRMPL
ncbi:MAG: hypothetical protein IH988_05070 [Planctomycetes bacterium]|nr:hypothetical protein [Planctomycetota bacterium]